MFEKFLSQLDWAKGVPYRLRGDIESVQRSLHALAVIERERYLDGIKSNPINDDPRRLLKFGFKVYSQNDEDGIIQEIFSRIGVGSKTFVEFGVDTGLENNTLKLLTEAWKGLWLEGSSERIQQINETFRDLIETGQLRVKQAFIDRDNINNLIGEFYSGEIDLLSIDVDGNDLYLFEALTIINPRVIIIEYNGKFPPPMSVAQVYNPTHRWSGADSGASLAALTKVADRKGYVLVGCNITGVNAFFVRRDLHDNQFCEPFTPENHYQPARYFLSSAYVSGHPPAWGPFVTIA